MSEYTMAAILRAACEELGVSERMAVSPSRRRDLCDARNLAYYVARRDGHTLCEIAAAVNRTHGGVSNELANQRFRIEGIKREEEKFNRMVENVKARLYEGEKD